MHYSEFLFSQLFTDYVTHTNTSYEEYEYDLIYGEVVRHFQAFMVSKYNTDAISEYDCMIKYLNNEVK